MQPNPPVHLARPEPDPSIRAADVAIALAPLVAGSVVGIATNASGRGWYRRLRKPAWTPPDAVFGPVWTALYLLMGLAAALVFREERGRARREPAERRLAAGSFAVQLALNLLWSVLFFGLRRVRPALVELVALWASIVATTIAFARIRLIAGLLLLPYLAWTTFAGLLNLDIARRNPRA